MVGLDGLPMLDYRYRRGTLGAGSGVATIANIAFLRARYPAFFEKFVSCTTVLVPPVDFEALDRFFTHEERFSTPRLRLPWRRR